MRQLFKKGISGKDVWRFCARQTMIALGATLVAFGFSLFQVPVDLAAGGVSGLAIVLNRFTGWSEGTQILAMNVPLLVLGYFYLGRMRFLVSTVLAVLVFSMATNIFTEWLPTALETYPVTEDLLLNALYAGIVFGLGTGIIFRAGGSIGGTSIPGRILQIKTGFPLGQSYLFTDGAIIFLAGLVFGWELALLALISLFFSGFASDFVLEGTSHVRTALIITDAPQELRRALMHGLDRGVTQWTVTGGYTDAAHTMLYCTVSRSQVRALKDVVADADPNAFVVIGVAQQAFGSGFRMLRRGRSLA
ncbi:YitT family protein [Desulfohalobium retbaense]|uniref:DUF2179 domain-containing protein n=1 Tax=Desulfohalobium retbaense (strain ATCC 49708 / DSM 5692 / JCM 16813 / HR100) TaxID=485915 RepID=C8X550_DESRD|nr:YitT family protein [Desulfohalobium retbaense]ACV69547.1 Protein of unknown function DUF2179 [Desulfohalobium retbaense DSM 5692]